MIYSYLFKNPQLFQDQREFVEKQIVFRFTDTVYIYISSLNDSSISTSTSAVRGDTILSFFRFKENQDGILITHAQQKDYCLTKEPKNIIEIMIRQAITFKNELIEQLNKT